jgi:hypothetical protein
MEESLYNIMKIDSLVIIRNKLEKYCDDEQLSEIYHKLSHYISDNCIHRYIDDFIDISLDDTKCITYCSICNKTK